MENNNIKIAIIGKMCSGKTTLSNYIHKYLKEKYNIQLQSLTFAGKVYDLAYELFDMDPNNKNRKLLQNIGTLMRSIDENVWVKYVMKKSKNTDVMVEDCRYENEFNALYENGFYLIKIKIDEEYQEERLRRTYPDTYQQHLDNRGHASETGIDRIEDDKCKLIINARDNELNFEIVREKIDRYLEELR